MGICCRARSSVWLEHLAHNQVVVGSNPSGPTFKKNMIIKRPDDIHRLYYNIQIIAMMFDELLYGSRML